MAVSLKYQEEIITILDNYGIEQYYCFAKSALREVIESVSSKKDKRSRVAYNGLDFLIAGFTKCGTTSMHYALNKIKSVYLPVGKETKFFSWYDKVQNAEDVFIKKYFGNIRAGQKVGTIDPTFYLNAKEIYQYFGTDVKIVFMMRNPIDATFSLYKMLNRNGDAFFDAFYQKYGVYHEAMFKNYFECVVKKENYPFNYIYWLEKFLKYYPKEQIKVLIFEELMKSPAEKLNDVLEFIGINEKCISDTFPEKNKGDIVMKDIKSYQIMKRYSDLNYQLMWGITKDENNGDEKVQRELAKVYKEYTKAKGMQLKASDKEREMLKQYYDTSVRSLETLLNRDLAGIWF